MSKPRLLVAEDKDTMRALLVRLLGETCVVDEALDGDEAIRLVTTESYDVVLTDIRMPGPDGFAVLEAVKKRSPDTEVIMLTAFASLDRAVEAIKLGAYDYLAKPFEPDELALVVARAVERRRLRAEAASLKRVISESRGFQRMLGRSAAMHEVFEQLQRAAATDITVLLTGETGTGKELAARAVHATSARAGGRVRGGERGCPAG
jgi:DNA-binding NtrC family response regulator